MLVLRRKQKSQQFASGHWDVAITPNCELTSQIKDETDKFAKLAYEAKVTID